MSRSLSFGFHPKCLNLRITHLAYVDYLLVFSKGDEQSISMLMNCLKEFDNMARLRVNQMKSSIYMARIDMQLKQAILDLSGFSSGHLPFRYLGIPLASSKLRTSYYSLLLDAVANKN